MENVSSSPAYIRPYVDDAPDDRRRHPRLRCKGSAELHFLEQDVRLRGVIVDLSMSGCAVDCERPLPRLRDAEVEVCLTIDGNRLLLRGVIRNTRRHELRAGVEFVEVTPRKAEQIKLMVRELVKQDAPVV